MSEGSKVPLKQGIYLSCFAGFVEAVFLFKEGFVAFFN